MGAYDDHAVNESGQCQFPGEEMSKGKDEERREEEDFHPKEKRQPILRVLGKA